MADNKRIIGGTMYISHSIRKAGLSEEFTPQFLSSKENIERVKSKIASIEDEDTRSDAVLDFPKALAEAKQWDEAEAALDFPTDIAEEYPHSHAHTVVAVAVAFLKNGLSERALLLAERAIRITEKTEDAWKKAEVINEAASIFSAAGHSSKALETRLFAADIAAADQDNDIDCSSVMKSITRDLARDGEFASAHRVASTIRNPVRKQSARYFIREEVVKRQQRGEYAGS